MTEGIKEANAFGDELDFQKVVEHLERIAPNFLCEICGAHDWGIDANNAKRSVGIVKFDFSITDMIGAIPAILLECQNCGNMKFLRRSTVSKKDFLAGRTNSSETP